jgi:hypothetical protein
VDAERAEIVADEIVKALSRETAVLADRSIRITTSVGVALFDGLSDVELLAYADLAMYEAKETGRNRFALYRPQRLKRTIVRERAVGHEKVTMRMPLQKVTRAGDRDHDARPRVRSDLSSHVLGEGLGAALRQVEQKLSPLPA